MNDVRDDLGLTTIFDLHFAAAQKHARSSERLLQAALCPGEVALNELQVALDTLRLMMRTDDGDVQHLVDIIDTTGQICCEPIGPLPAPIDDLIRVSPHVLMESPQGFHETKSEG